MTQANLIKQSGGIPWELLGSFGSFLLLLFAAILIYMYKIRQPVLQKALPTNNANSETKTYHTLSMLVEWIKESLVSYMSKISDCLTQIHKDVIDMKGRDKRTHEDVKKILNTQDCVANDIHISFNNAIKNSVEHHILPEFEAIKRKFKDLEEQLDKLRKSKND